MFDNLSDFLYMIPVVLLSLTFHEFSHAFVAYKLGDPTAKNLGRLTLNPLKHLDILGTIMMFAGRFGWAKPVPINPMYFKDHKKGTILVSVAGPLSNLVLAFLFYIPAVYLQIMVSTSYNLHGIYAILGDLCGLFYVVNVNLAVFNILPVPPLDGSKILGGILPRQQYYKLLQYENYIGVIFILLIFMAPKILNTIMQPFQWVINTAVSFIADPILRLLL